MLLDNDRDFLIQVLELENNPSTTLGLKKQADIQLTLHLVGLEKNNEVLAREMALMIIRLKPPQGDAWKSVVLAADIIHKQIHDIAMHKGPSQRPPDPAHTARANGVHE